MPAKNLVPAAIRAAAAALLTAATLAGAAGGAAYAAENGPAYAGRLVFRIVARMPGPRHAAVTASGAFKARGYFVRKDATLVFPHGRVTVRRHILSTTYTPPNLSTCTFTIRQNGTFAVIRATGRYRGLHDTGTFRTTLRGQAPQERTGPVRQQDRGQAHRHLRDRPGPLSLPGRGPADGRPGRRPYAGQTRAAPAAAPRAQRTRACLTCRCCRRPPNSTVTT